MTTEAADAASQLDFTEKWFLRKLKILRGRKIIIKFILCQWGYPGMKIYFCKDIFSFMYQWEYTGKKFTILVFLHHINAWKRVKIFPHFHKHRINNKYCTWFFKYTRDSKQNKDENLFEVHSSAPQRIFSLFSQRMAD